MTRRELPEEMTPCTTLEQGKCENPNHDHRAGEGMDVEEDNQTPDGWKLCNDCGVPTHYDEAGDYSHDDPAAPPCFLHRAVPEQG